MADTPQFIRTDRLRGQNLLIDPGFEGGDIGIWAFNGAGVLTIPLAPAAAHSGDRYARIVHPFGNSFTQGFHNEPIPVRPYDVIEFGCWMLRESGGTTTLRPTLPMYNAALGFMQTAVAPNNPAADGVWGFMTSQIVIPLGVAYIRPGFQVSGAGGALDTLARFDDYHCVLL